MLAPHSRCCWGSRKGQRRGTRRSSFWDYFGILPVPYDKGSAAEHLFKGADFCFFLKGRLVEEFIQVLAQTVIDCVSLRVT